MNLYTLTLVVLAGALVIVFIQDIAKIFKRLAKIPGVLLFGPLLTVSAALYAWEVYAYISLVHIQAVYFWPVNWLQSQYGENARLAGLTALLTLTALLPVLLIDIWLRRTRFYGLDHPARLHAFLFLFATLLLWLLPFVT
ncbi:hypothetical protein Lgee_0791 [Legionella geestiana]|uniref:Uncharacterized protein n=1 Tax=Legionella geestiana TaxID=45065 RepID=A0A0W0U367_9GAMM|nr:hypothetical protein [Legionella geestiana]KTD01995.1 hypothetical protein Lgee_0791 [Legionella geestiana]QBS12038.1 hypothetical protein E4T54_04390 [Legionella geestiana]QDQ40352.1 hypothetical protein E3226_008050 [Legionella geestiana]STX53243.1 Uncharacterised protein [Legionella geestiana]